MPSTYTLISSNVLTSSAASVTFSAIPSTYTDLVLRISARGTGGGIAANVYANFNGETLGSTTNYSRTILGVSGGSSYSGRNSNDSALAAYSSMTGSASTASTFGSVELYIPNYTSSSNKPISSFGVAESNTATTDGIATTAGLWRITNAITQILLTSGTGDFVSGSSFYLYGIKNS